MPAKFSKAINPFLLVMCHGVCNLEPRSGIVSESAGKEVNLVGGGGQGGGRPGEKGAGGVREAGEEEAGSGIPKVAGSGRKRENLYNIAQYFAIEKMQRGGSQKIQGGNRD